MYVCAQIAKLRGDLGEGFKARLGMMGTAIERGLSQRTMNSQNDDVVEKTALDLLSDSSLTVEELEELLEVVKTPVMDHESKAVFGATAYALKEFFLSIASRYDLSKHQR